MILHYPNQAKPEVKWNIDKRIYREEDILSPDVCNSIIEYGKNAVRPSVNKYPGVFQVKFHSCLLEEGHPVHAELLGVWNRVVDYFGFAINHIEPYELKRYTERDFFEKHVDNYYGLEINQDRKITMSIQLSDPAEYVGGDLRVVSTRIRGKQGSIVAFPSFFPHEVTPIASGTRWSLIGWAWGPYWR